MINWNFNANDYEEQTFKPVPAGDHRVRIASAEEQISNTGNQMIKLVLEVSGYNSTIWHFIVFMQDNQKMTNQKLGELWNSFGMQQGNLNLQTWIGKVGAAKVKHEDYKGESKAKIAFFLNKEKQNKMAPWVEPGNKATIAKAPEFTEVTSDVPWN
jgi:hypothetical protein